MGQKPVNVKFTQEQVAALVAASMYGTDMFGQCHDGYERKSLEYAKAVLLTGFRDSMRKYGKPARRTPEYMRSAT